MISEPTAEQKRRVLDIIAGVSGEAVTRDLAFNIREIVAHGSSFYTLHPRDVIMVGTPAGFEQVRAGDKMTARIQDIGVMHVHAP